MLFTNLPNQNYHIYFVFVSVVGRYQTPNYVVLLAAIVCIGALLLPTQGDQGTAIPIYLHLSSNLKLIFAYVLGV